MRDYIGEKFERLTVVEEVEAYVSPGGSRMRKVKCLCVCGGVAVAMVSNLYNGSTKSCGCYKLEKARRGTHHMSRTVPYHRWNQMIMRCENRNTASYKHYGGRGITVCKKWKKFEGFWEDMKDGFSTELTIDRIDTNKGYSRENCRWATMRTQQNNRTNNRLLTLDGRVMTLMQWARELGVNRQTIDSRLRRGWTTVEALTTPVRIKTHSVFFKPKQPI